KEDVENIENKIFHKKDTDLMEITTFFNKDNFYIDKDFETKEECINFLSNEAIKKGLMDETSKKSVFEREEISSTSIGDLTAIPHPIATDTKKSFISILVLNKPIMWGDFLVQVVFLLNIEKSKANLWEPMFLKLYNYIKEKNGINSLLKNKSYDMFLKEFISFSQI
ncbi:PTS sugar transporter subunit IIA, partial [Megamonas funiformis]